MSLIKSLLMDKKIFEASEDIDKFLEENEVDEAALVQSIEFDKSVFGNEDLVNDFMQAHLFASLGIEDIKDKYLVTLLGEEGFIETTIKKVPLREGIVIVVGVLRPMTSDNPFFFREDGKNIKLNADVPHIIELANVVKGFHARFGEVEITTEMLQSFKNNFDEGVVGIDISIDFDHEVREAAGWLKEIFLSVDQTTLLGVVRWTPKGALSLSDKEFRYFSPEFNNNFIHPHTGKEHGPTLMGGALTNRPFLKMEPMVELNNKNPKEIEKVDTIKLSEHNEKVGALSKEISDLKLSEAQGVNIVANMKAENEKLAEENKTLKEAKETAEKNEKHNTLFSEGKINKAQLDMLNEGKDLYEVLRANVKLNINPDGKNVGADTVQLDDSEAAMAKKLNLTTEEFQKYNQ